MSAYQLVLLSSFAALVLGLARRFPSFALSRPVSLLVSLVGLGLGGLLAFFFLPVELMPNASFGVITITTPVRGGMSPLDVENLVSKPIEEAVSSVAHVRDLFSNSKSGKSVVSLEFEPGTNMDFAALDVREKFSKVQGDLPREIEHPIIAHYRESDVPVFIFSLTSARQSPEELRTLVDGGLKEKLLRVKGVANAEVAGGRERKIIIDVDRHALAAQGLDIREVVRAIEESNLNLQTGAIQSNAVTTSIRAMGQFANVGDIKETVIGFSKQGTALHVKDVAEVKDSFMELESLSRLNEASAVTVYLQKESDANTVQVVKRVKKVLEPFEKTLASDTELVEISNQADAIQAAIGSVRSSLFLGIILVMAVLGFFLGLQSAAAVALSIPLATLVTGAIMYLEKLSLNVMTLSGLALGIGLLVDNSIVVLETLYKALEGVIPAKAGIQDGSPIKTFGDDGFLKDVILKEAGAVTPAIIGGTLTTVVVFVPFLLLSKQIQILYAGVAITITAALVASLYVALTTIPAYVFKIKTTTLPSTWAAGTGFKTAFPQAEVFIQRLQALYARWLPMVLEKRTKFLAFMGLLFLSAVYVFQFHVEKNFSMGEERNEFIVFVELPSGKRMEISDRVVKEAEEKIRSQKEIASSLANVTTRIEGWSSKVYVSLKPQDERPYSSEEIIDKLRPLMKDIGRKEDAFVYFSSPREGQEILVNIYGEEEKVVADYAMQVAGLFDRESGFKDTKIRYRPGRPEARVMIDPQRAALFGLSPTDVGNVLHAGTRGLRASYYREKGEEIETVVRLKVDQRDSVESIKTLLIPTPRGGQVPLAQIADFDFSLAPSEIWRHNKERMIQVSANISKMSLEKAAGKVKRLLSELPFNTDYWARIGGDYEERLQAQRDFLQALLVTSLLIFAVMACLFESLLQPLMLFVSVPLAGIGIVLALVVTGTPVTMGVMIGILMTGGIAINNAILLIDKFNAGHAGLRPTGVRPDDSSNTLQLLIEAGRDRLRPILMTTATTMLGLLPMAMDRSNGAELWRPMAITTIGGLLVSMVLTLFVLPCLIVFVEELRFRRTRAVIPAEAIASGDPVFNMSSKNGETSHVEEQAPLKGMFKAWIPVFAGMTTLAAVSYANPSAPLPGWVDQMVIRRVNDLLAQGRNKEKEKEYGQAIEIYLDAVTLAPSNSKARASLLRANAKDREMKWKEHEKKRAGYVSQAQDKRRATKATVQALDGKLSEAARMASRGRLAQACDIVLQVLEEDPSYVPAIRQREEVQEKLRKRLNAGGKFASEDEKQVAEGFLYFSEMKWNSAIEAWRPVVENAEPMGKWGRTVNLGAYAAKANQNLVAQERQTKIDQAIAEGLKNFRESQLEAAQASFDEALKLDPTNTQAKQYVRLIPGLLESARQNILSEVKQQQINTALSDATEFFLKGYLDEAESKVKLILDEMPHHTGALALAEEIREARGLPKLPSIEELRTKEQIELDELYSQGIIAFAEGRLDDAKGAWESILAKNPNHGNAIRALKKIKDEQ